MTLGIVGILVGGLIAAELAVPLQPSIGGNNTVIQTGGPVVTMPPGVGSNLQANFGPSKITVFIGVNNTVTFDNLDSVVHTVTATGLTFDSLDVLPSAKWNYTFTSAGTFSYFCKYHGWMKGSVVVKQGGGVLGSLRISIPSGTGSNPSLNYQPASLTVIIGVNNTVIFANLDSTIHTVTAGDGSFDSGDIQAGGIWTRTFATAGTFAYHCKYHTWMSGTITVKSP